jgi:predicted dehydrogenase
MKKVAIIGAGLQARRRAPAIVADPGFQLAWIVDRNEERAAGLAAAFAKDARVATDWKAAVSDPSVDAVVVLTYPDTHAAISIAALEAGKDVLCEKPLCRTEDEAKAMVETARKKSRILKCGFNHRFHPAVAEAHRLFTSGKIGKAVFGRGKYGIAGRQGVEKEWRSDPKIVGGGQLMEQGVHLVDLFRWFFGEPDQVTGMRAANRWPLPAPLEDNGFLLMQNAEGVIASVHASLTQWINLFEFEVYGEKGSLTVQGLGASYGAEKLVVSEHDASGPFSHQTIEYRGEDASWKAEWKDFAGAIAARTRPSGDGEDGWRAMRIVNAAYDAAGRGRTVELS